MNFKMFIEFISDNVLLITINEIDIYCQYTKSKSGNYLLATCDKNIHNKVEDYGNEGNGLYFLFNNNNLLITSGQAERPKNGKVANNGNFIINDWLFDNNSKSIIYCFDYDGNKIIEIKLNSHLINNAISDEGNFAIFQTASSNYQEDNNQILFFNLSEKKLLWKKQVNFPKPNNFTILENDKIITVNYDEFDSCNLDWEGNILNEVEFQVQYLSSLEGNRAIYETIKLLERFNQNSGLTNILKEKVKNENITNETKAKCYRFLGEIIEKQNSEEAIHYFELALHYNPKIGLKNKIKYLKDKLF